MALAILGIYIWSNFLTNSHSTLTIGLFSAVAAVLCVISSVAGWFLAEKTKAAFICSLASYLLLALTATIVLNTTGGAASPYVFLWTLLATFAVLFGIWSLAPILLIACAHVAILFINKELNQQSILPTILVIGVPIVLSIIVWSRAQGSIQSHERDPVAYKQRSEELTNLVEESEVVINAIGDGVLAVDSQGIIQLINPAAQALLGWSKQDALSLQYQSVLKLTDEQDKELSDANEPIKQTLNTNQEVRSGILRLETKNGKKLYVSLVVSPLGNAGSGVIAVVRDITKERSEEREQAEFISTASHEMRTPVASIEGYLGLALNPNTATVDEKARDFITKAHESAQHLGRLFQDLLDVSKAEDGRLSNNPTVIDIVAFTGDVVEGLRQKAIDKGLQLTFKPGANNGDKGERRLSPVYYANLDKDHVREIVNNLTENAIKYTLTGEVSIDVTGDGEHVTISISDSGIGIPAEDLPHLFQKFYRVDNSDTREIGGTGLGLYLCRRLVETLGGRIWAESVYKQGSTFHVELPRIDTQEAQRLMSSQILAASQAVTAAEDTSPATVFTVAATSPVIQQPVASPAPVSQAPQEVTQPQPYVQPVAPQPQPVPTNPEPAPAPQPVQTAPAPTQPPVTRLNIPLTHIEQNPGVFMQQRPGTVAVPPRDAYNQPK